MLDFCKKDPSFLADSMPKAPPKIAISKDENEGDLKKQTENMIKKKRSERKKHVQQLKDEAQEDKDYVDSIQAGKYKHLEKPGGLKVHVSANHEDTDDFKECMCFK